jgi:hypothetical protein
LRFETGDVVALREIWLGRVWKARPWIVVHDRPDQLALYIPKGSPTKIPPGSGIPRDDWTLEDGVWGRPTLRLTTPGTAHSVLVWWENCAFEGWYVNLEQPLVRGHVGFDYLDQDEFAEAQRLGVITPEDAAAVREEAARVTRMIEAWEPPFSDGWESWRPDAAWTTPELPAGWDAVA